MKLNLSQPTYGFISEKDKEFIVVGVKDKKVAARIYIRDNGTVLRLFFNNIDKHRGYIENAPEFIRLPFVSNHGNCHYCPNKKNDICKFRKTYTIGSRQIEKCSGVTFEFEKPDTDKLPDYMALLREFYPVHKGNGGELK